MSTTYETALNEFRDASAEVRRFFGAVSEARELQIIADSQHKQASNALADAQARLDRADKALSAARAQPEPVFASFRDPMPAANGVNLDAADAGISIG